MYVNLSQQPPRSQMVLLLISIGIFIATTTITTTTYVQGFTPLSYTSSSSYLLSLPTTRRTVTTTTTTSSSIVVLYNTVDNDTNNKVSTGTEGAFVPLSNDGVNEEGDDNDEDDDEDDEDLLNKVEMFGKGAAKVCMYACMHVCLSRWHECKKN
jgi:hypothetical protein